MLKKKIIIFDNNEDLIESINSSSYNIDDFTFFIANDFQQARYLTKKNLPDLLLISPFINNFEGTDFFQYIRSELYNEFIPIILLVPKNKLDSEEILGMEHNADGIIHTPINSKHLSEKIHNYFLKIDKIKQKYEEQINNLKGSISIALPHEFRTSLNTILGYSNAIYDITNQKFDVNPKVLIDINEIKDMSKAIVNAGNYLSRLTENIILYTKLQLIHPSETNHEIEKNRIYNSKEIIEEIIYTFQNDTNRKNDIIYSIENCIIGLPYYHFHKIIFELIENAIKFSVFGTPIKINTHIENNLYKVSIFDSGIGMTEEQLENVGAYKQFDRDYYEQQGAGLGLILAKELVSIYNGKFEINSQLNVGTEVIIYLPIIVI